MAVTEVSRLTVVSAPSEPAVRGLFRETVRREVLAAWNLAVACHEKAKDGTVASATRSVTADWRWLSLAGDWAATPFATGMGL